MSGFTIQPVTGACRDLVAALVKLHRLAFPAHMQIVDPSDYFTEALNDGRNINIVMQDQAGNLIGYLLGIPQSLALEDLRQWDPAMQDDPDRMYLEMIQTLPAPRGSSRGLSLIQMGCAEAEKRSIFKLSMHARVDTGWSGYLHRIFTNIRFLRRLENWYGFGEPFDYLEATTTLKQPGVANRQGDGFSGHTFN